MWIFLFILFIIGVVIVWPVLKVVLKIRSQYRQFNRMMNGEMPGSSSQTKRSRKERQAPRQSWKKKKIDDSVGEYVEFEDIRVDEAEREAERCSSVKFKAEQQISDVEFEDLP